MTELQRQSRSDYVREWYRRQPAKARKIRLAKARAYYRANRVSIKAKQKVYNALNIENYRRWSREADSRYRARLKALPPDPVRLAKKRERWAQWKQNNPAKIKAMRRRYKLKNRDRLKFRQSADKMARRARMFGAYKDGTATPFYRLIRSQRFLNCAYCNNPISGRKAQIDHIVPLCKGGAHTRGNLCAACPECNQNKNGRTLTEWIPSIKRPVIIGV